LPRNKYPEETVRKILDASLQLFLEKGYEQTTVLDIVNNLGGLTRGAFYHHFKSKEEVLEALSEQLFQEDNPFEVVQREAGLNGLEKIRMVMQFSVKETANEDRISLAKMALPLLSNPYFLAQHLKSNLEMSRMFVPLIEEGMADGSIRSGNAKLLAELLMLTFNFWMVPSVFPTDELVFEDKSMLIKEIFDSLGLPVMDESFLGKGEAFANLLGVPPCSDIS